MADKNTTLNTDTILEDIKKILNEKGTFCSEEEFRYYFLSENRAALNGNNNYSLEYPFMYYKNHEDYINKDKDKGKDKNKDKKVDAILWDPKKPDHGLYAFEFKYAHEEFESHGKCINDQTPTINVRYNFLEDIDRLESLLDYNDMEIDVGYAIFLTDKKAYRSAVRNGAKGRPLSLIDGAKFESGTEVKAEGEGTGQYYKPMIFRSTYTIHWNQIDGTRFWCCIVEVKPKDK